MNDISDSVREKFDYLGTSYTRFGKASRGLLTRLAEESERQLEELIKTGESAQKKGETPIKKIQSLLTTKPNREDFTHACDQTKYAALGLYSKALGFYTTSKKSTQKYFNELVGLGSAKPAAE